MLRPAALPKRSVKDVAIYLFSVVLTFICTRWWVLSGYEHGAVLHQRENAYKLKQAQLDIDMPKLKSRSFIEIQDHNDNIKNNLPEQLCVPTAWHIDLPWMWFIFKPNWECAHKERIGEKFDGGKWHCNLLALEGISRGGGKCVAYSLGSNGQIDYELALQARTGCEIHIFDPTLPLQKKTIPTLPPGITFHSVGIGGVEGLVKVQGVDVPVKPLGQIMKELGHTHLHSLKMDIDGYEYDALNEMAATNWGHSVLRDNIDELLIEFHWKGHEKTMAAFEQILQAGFRIFSHEPNLFYIMQPAAGMEYSFVHNRVAHKYEGSV